MKKYIILLLILLLPFNVLAYSDKIIPGGDTLGIEVKNKGVIIVGFYRVKSKLNKNNLKVGDTILKVNNEEVTCIDNMIKLIEKNIKDNKVTITIKREDKELEKEIEIDKVDGVYKTGLYVKDNIIGIGTLSYIDPETKIYGALGHEIIEITTNKLIEVKTGKIFKTSIKSIDKSVKGLAGTKNAKFCEECRPIVHSNNIKGKNHPNYKEWLTDEDREDRRNREDSCYFPICSITSISSICSITSICSIPSITSITSISPKLSIIIWQKEKIFVPLQPKVETTFL